jgi:predicted DNA-binding transcriptional regulator AlpA
MLVPIELLTEREVAQRLSLSVAALRKWRQRRQGPIYLKVGKCVRYPLADLEIWLFARIAGGEERRSNAPEQPSPSGGGREGEARCV